MKMLCLARTQCLIFLSHFQDWCISTCMTGHADDPPTVTDVSGQTIGHMFKGQVVQGFLAALPLKMGRIVCRLKVAIYPYFIFFVHFP
jgi:hypothetical protein